MESAFLRVHIHPQTGSFAPLIVQTGLPLLDKWQAASSLLRDWLGRFAAEPVWDDETVNYYVRDDDGARLAGVWCEPATDDDLRGPLRDELTALRERLSQAAPQSASARAIHGFLSRGLEAEDPSSGLPRFRHQWFKYRDVSGPWRLVWCWGYQDVKAPGNAQHVVCANPDCRHLALVEPRTGARCSHCGQRLGRRSLLARSWKGIAAMLLALLCGAALYWATRPGVATLDGAAELAGQVLYILGSDEYPVAKARVAAIGMNLPALETDENGTFHLTSLPPGPVRLQITADGFSVQDAEAEATLDKDSMFRCILRGDGTIHGTVVSADEMAIPVRGAEVRAIGLPTAVTRTDAEGRFSLDGLPPVPLQVQASHPEFEHHQVAGRAGPESLRIPLAAIARESEAMQPPEMPPEPPPEPSPVTPVRGRVVSAANGQPVPGATIAVADSQLTAITDAEGRFALPDGVGAERALHVSADGFVARDVAPTLAEDERSLADIVLTPTVEVRGVVVRAVDGQPIADARVAVAEPRTMTQADQEGQFHFSGLPAGPLRLGAMAAGFQNRVMEVRMGTEPVRIELTGEAAVRGRVVDSLDRRPLAGATVVVNQTQQRASTDAEGRFELAGIPALPAGFDVAATGHLPENFTRQLTAGEQDLGEFVLTPEVEVHGQVVRAWDGKPLAGAEVTCAGTEVRARTGADGTFVLRSLPPGAASVRIEAGGFQPQERTWDLTPGTQSPERVALAGDTLVKGVTLDAADRGRAIPNARVELSVAGTPKTITTGADGGFDVGDVPSGPVEVTAQAPGYQDARLRTTVNPRAAWIELAMQPVPMEKPAAVAKPAPSPPQVPKAEREPPKMAADPVPERPGPAGLQPDPRRRGGIRLHGTVVNAINNNPIPKARVDVTVGGHQETAYTGEDGRFQIADVPEGIVGVNISKTGFESAKLEHHVGRDGPIRAALSPILVTGQVRIILTWGEQPQDLDAHLFGPGAGASRWHLSYRQARTANATLDVDAKEGFGPETITLRAVPGTYQYMVAHPARRGTADGSGLAASRAMVHVYYGGQGKVDRFEVPSKPRGSVWHVFDLQVRSGREIFAVPANQWLTEVPAQ